ncbi:MAG: hypothetical protein HYX53_04250 [Chloroflexi bacterium]|nr:hypothetical protein [Chloroflexota bacterium]
MRDDHDRPGERAEGFFQHLGGRDVEVVRGLIEQQAIGVELHEARQLHAALFAAAQPRDWQLCRLIRDEEARELRHGLPFKHRACFA